MKKILLAALLIATTGAGAATRTVYRDRFLPGGACMVDFNGATINAALVQQVHHAKFSIRVGEYKYEYPLFGKYKDLSTYRDAILLRVTMVNGNTYDQELPAEQAEPAKLAFLKHIEEKCQ